MKKLFLLAVLASVVIFSCKKSTDDSKSNISGSIVGKWHFTADTLIFTIPGLTDQHYTNTFQSGDYVQFNSDGSGNSLVTDPGETTQTAGTFTYKLNASTLILNFPKEVVDNVTYDAYSDTAHVRILTSSKLAFEYKETYTDASGTSVEDEIDYLAK